MPGVTRQKSRVSCLLNFDIWREEGSIYWQNPVFLDALQHEDCQYKLAARRYASMSTIKSTAYLEPDSSNTRIEEDYGYSTWFPHGRKTVTRWVKQCKLDRKSCNKLSSFRGGLTRLLDLGDTLISTDPSQVCLLESRDLGLENKSAT